MNCDPLARWYRWLEYVGFGRALERRRSEFLPLCGDARRVLMLGEGDGRFLAACRQANRAADIVYVDSSREMLSLARCRTEAIVPTGAAAMGRTNFHRADALTWLQDDDSSPFDLVTMHFFLDCFPQASLEEVVCALGRRCAPRARWVVSEFRCPPHGMAALWSRALVWLLYVFFRVFAGLEARRLPDHATAFRAAGFRRVEQVVAAGGLLVSEHWQRG